jgi:imidazolonepropionase
VATVLPAVVLDGWGPIPPARLLVDAGAAVAIASNFNPHGAPTWNIQTVIALACRHLAMTPEEAIAAATINGAYALGRGDRAGSIEPGKVADLILLNTDDYRDIARYFGVNLVHMTIKSGVPVYREGELREIG